MEKIIKLTGGGELPLKSTAITLLIYKNQFRSDLLKDTTSIAVQAAEESLQGADAITKNDGFDIEIGIRVVWAMAKTYAGYNSDFPDYESWLESLYVSPTQLVSEIIPEAIKLLNWSRESTVQPKNG